MVGGNFGGDVTCVVLSGHSPDSHFPIHVILADCVVADIDGSRVVIHIRLGSYVFGCLVVGEEEVVGFSIAVEHGISLTNFAAVFP